MVCKYCGYDTSKSARFCENCGASLLDEDVVRPVSDKTQAVMPDMFKRTKASEGYNRKDEMRRTDVKEAEEFFALPEDDFAPITNYSDTRRTSYSRSGNVIRSTPFVTQTFEEQLTPSLEFDDTNQKRKKTARICLISVVVLLAIFLVGILIFWGVVAGNDQAADSSTDITMKTYNKINNSMSYHDVVDLIGRIPNKTSNYTSANGEHIRECTWSATIKGVSRSITVTFTNTILSDKDFYNLDE